MSAAATTNLAGGVTGAAQYRVSEDGGLTWGTQLFTASELITQPLIYNDTRGHAYLTTNFVGLGNDIQLVAREYGTFGQDISFEILDDGTGLSVNTSEPPDNDPFKITVHLAAGGNTAAQVVAAINADPVISQMVNASLKDYQEGGAGNVLAMQATRLSGVDEQIQDLGHATMTTTQEWAPPQSSPNIKFTAVDHGVDGNDVRVEYVVDGGAATTVDLPVLDGSYYVVRVHLEQDPITGDSVATAQDVVDAVMLQHYTTPPGASPNYRIIAELADYPEGGGVVQQMDPTALTGGDDDLLIRDFGARIRFEDNGTTLVAGDRFNVDVDYYNGDDLAIDLNANQNTRVTSNLPGDEVLGKTGASDNILDTLSRLKYALDQHDSELVAEELDSLRNGLEKLTTEMSRLGVRLIRNEFTYNILESTEVNSTDRMSRVEDLDIADAVTQLQIKQTAYQALLASTSLITRLSLVDYIR